MNALLIATEKYSQDLRQALKHKYILSEGAAGNQRFFILSWNVEMAGLLVGLMTDIILRENALINASRKLRQRVRAIVFDTERAEMERALLEFLSETGRPGPAVRSGPAGWSGPACENRRMINLDGYVRFRMGYYADRINHLLYAAVKKNLRGKQREKNRP
ncbi:MAG: hypothetical protein LBS62_11030 [Clostridiales bacterium]|nr:hypothetical protein [Clostridiales bacterium]